MSLEKHDERLWDMHLCVGCGRLFRGRDDWNEHARQTGPEHKWTIIRLAPASRLAELETALEEKERLGAECICWKGNDSDSRTGSEWECPRHRDAAPWEALRLAAGYFQAIEEQLRPMLDHPDTPDEFRLSAYGVAMETAANIAEHQRRNIERGGIEAVRVSVSVLPSDMRGDNALAWLAGSSLSGGGRGC